MSAGLYGSVDGVNRKIKKLYANVNGVNREIKEMWAVKDGVNRKIFQSGIRWTYEITGDSDSHASYMVSKDHSALLCWNGSQSDGTTWCKATYTFPEPFTIKAGETITADASDPQCYRAIQVYVNSDSTRIIVSAGSAQSYIGGSYTFTEDTVINNVVVFLTLGKNGKANYVEAHVHVNLSSDSFILNNSGSSDQ